VRVEPAYEEADPFEQSAHSASACNSPFALPDALTCVTHRWWVAAADVLAERLQRHVELTIDLPL
jgi:hypothetical protein